MCFMTNKASTTKHGSRCKIMETKHVHSSTFSRIQYLSPLYIMMILNTNIQEINERIVNMIHASIEAHATYHLSNRTYNQYQKKTSYSINTTSTPYTFRNISKTTPPSPPKNTQKTFNSSLPPPLNQPFCCIPSPPIGGVSRGSCRVNVRESLRLGRQTRTPPMGETDGGCFLKESVDAGRHRLDVDVAWTFCV